MTLDKYEERPSCEQCRTDRILSAHNAELDRIAAGMPELYIEDLGDLREDGSDEPTEDDINYKFEQWVNKVKKYILEWKNG
jgi:hypothetical protein